MLCGFPPFFSEYSEELFDLIKNGKYDFPSPDWDDISKEGIIRGSLTRLKNKYIYICITFFTTAICAYTQQIILICKNKLIIAKDLIRGLLTTDP